MARKRSAFGNEFAAARAAGKDNFSFGGKSYNTRVKGEKVSNSDTGGTVKVAKKATALPKTTGIVPTSRPNGLLPDTTTATPASRQGAEIQKMATYKAPADKGAMDRVTASIAAGKPRSDFMARPQGIAPAPANRTTAKADRLPKTVVATKEPSPERFARTKEPIPERFARTKEPSPERFARSMPRKGNSSDISDHDYSRLSFFKK